MQHRSFYEFRTMPQILKFVMILVSSGQFASSIGFADDTEVWALDTKIPTQVLERIVQHSAKNDVRSIPFLGRTNKLFHEVSQNLVQSDRGLRDALEKREGIRFVKRIDRRYLNPASILMYRRELVNELLVDLSVSHLSALEGSLWELQNGLRGLRLFQSI